MSSNHDKLSGIQSLDNHYRERFRIPENLDHYSDEDFGQAERKFLKFSLYGENAVFGSDDN
jgi:hypothetical protein